MAKKVGKRGPKAGRLRINGDWQSAVGKALTRKRPSKGWPEKGKQNRKSD